MSYDARRTAERHGHSAERRAVWWLRLKGYRVLAERHRNPGGEIDLIVRRGRTIAFVEVKARATLQGALDAVTPQQRGRITAAAEGYLIRNPAYADFALRFDVVAIVPARLPHHIQNAWGATD